MPSSEGALRQRKPGSASGASDSPITELQGTQNEIKEAGKDEVVWGKTPSGEVFRVPTTHDVLTTLFHPGYPKSHLDLLNLGLLGLQVILFFTLSRKAAQIFFFFYFAFWRAAYDGGLGWILTRQSKKKWIVREVQKRGWLDETRRPAVRNWIRKQLVGKMGKDYSFDELPLEYNTWLLFRQLVDVILVNDFLSYCLFAFSCFRVPADLSIAVHIMRWVGGIGLIAFNIWVKTEAHNVVKDYGWYWGDCFFQRGALVFDGVFELAPHPMYSVGYAGYYGLSLISGSYAVLFVSLAGHAAQFAFLVFFENPHIERLYGQRKAIAKRTPLITPGHGHGLKFDETGAEASSSTPSRNGTPIAPVDNAYLSTPGVTEGDTATETELETDVDADTEILPGAAKANSFSTKVKLPKTSRHQTSFSVESTVSSDGGVENGSRAGPVPRSEIYSIVPSQNRKVISQHDLLHKYFRRDAVVLRNVDLLRRVLTLDWIQNLPLTIFTGYYRATDAMLVLIMFYGLVITFLPSLSAKSTLVLHFLHALAWCLAHYFGLGLLLRAQSESKFLVRHYLENYPYDHLQKQNAILEAFSNWKAIYNLSMCMTYVSCVGVAWKAYELPRDWTVGSELLRHTLGAILIALHVWTTLESYEVLGLFGWFFGDFFMEEYPAHLEYTGIYRYLNNPEAMGGAAYFGLASISGSKLVLSLAVIRHLANWWFLSCVEHPHMRKLYGDSLRKDAGFVKVMKNVASKNAKILESRAGRHAPELKRVAREVIGTFDKVYEETADAVEEFLARSAPRISEVVQETKVLLRQSREKLVITRVANDISSYDTSKYRISVIPSPKTGRLAFHLGEPIRIKWQAPPNHSRKDWIGLYRVGANKSRLVTKTSSMGMWTPVHDEEWDGDFPIGFDQTTVPHFDANEGIVTFKGNTLPWLVGRYEVRYHHDGKYNVMSIDGPIEIYVDKPDEISFETVRTTLQNIVPLCLDNDPSLIPLSCKIPDSKNDSDSDDAPLLASDSAKNAITHEEEPDQEYRDPDDFSFWSERQAKRICDAIKQIFDVEFAPEVIVADANLTTLTNRILVSKEILSSGP